MQLSERDPRWPVGVPRHQYHAAGFMLPSVVGTCPPTSCGQIEDRGPIYDASFTSR